MSYVIVITQNMTYQSFMSYDSDVKWGMTYTNMSIWVSNEPEGQKESNHQYETLLKIHLKMKNEKFKNCPIYFVF